MVSELLNAVERLRNSVEKLDLGLDRSIDAILCEQRPKVQATRAQDALKRDLEEDYLTPPTSFSSEWLNTLQQYVIRQEGLILG